MIKITLVFYQFPEAMHELEAWEKTQKVHKKIVDEQGRIIYTLIDKNEFLYCFDINNYLLKEILHIFQYSTRVYNKTLIFGKVTYMDLVKLQQVLVNFEL